MAPSAAESRILSLYRAATAALEADRIDIARPLLEQVAVEQPRFRDVQQLLDELDDAESRPLVTTAQLPPDLPTAKRQSNPSPIPGPTPGHNPGSTSGHTRTDIASPPTMQERLRRALLVIGTPRGRARALAGSFGGSSPWASCSSSASALSSGGWCGSVPMQTPVARRSPRAVRCARSVNIACALEAPRIDGTFAEWTDGTSHPIPEAAGDGTTMARHASWKARWDNSGLYLYAKVQDGTPGADSRDTGSRIPPRRRHHGALRRRCPATADHRPGQTG